MKTVNQYTDVTVHRLFNALLELWDKPRNQRSRAKAEVVLKDVIDIMEDNRIKENRKRISKLSTNTDLY